MFPVAVVDKHGNAVSGLPVSAFRAELQHRPVKLLSATFQTQQPRIVVLLDTSRSISSSPGEWELAKFLVADIVNSGVPESDLAFATFATHLTVEVPFGNGRDAIREVLLERARPLRPAAALQNHTALCDAILEATKLFSTPRLGDAIYVITDGMDNESKGGIGQMQHELEQEGIRLFCSILRSGMFRFPNGRMLPPDLHIIPDGLRLVAQHTGGYSVVFDVARFNHTVGSTRAMAIAAQTIYHRLAPFYAVDAELPSALDKPREWKLEVLNSGARRPRASLCYIPEQYVLAGVFRVMAIRCRTMATCPWRLGREKPCPIKRQKNRLDSDRPSHGKRYHSLQFHLPFRWREFCQCGID